MKFIFSFLFLSFTLQSAEFYNSIDQSNWHIKDNSIFECSIYQKIKNYGTFELSYFNGNKSSATLKPYNKPLLSGNAKLSFIPFIWNTQPKPEHTKNINYYSQFDIELNNVEEVEHFLLSNRQINLYYKHMNNTHYSVSVNPIHFNTVYDSLSQCKLALLPFSFEDIQRSILFFENNKSELKKESDLILQNIINFLKNTQDKYSIIIESHSDSYGSREHNLKISEKRANLIKSKLSLFSSDITVLNLGEKRFVSPNYTASGRDQNRRVIIKINKI